MIRFIKCSGLYGPDDSGQFAFYDTVIDSFIDIAGDQLFETVSELMDAMMDAKYQPKAKHRLLSLIPDGWD